MTTVVAQRLFGTPVGRIDRWSKEEKEKAEEGWQFDG
jgi:hypothetical protein